MQEHKTDTIWHQRSTDETLELLSTEGSGSSANYATRLRAQYGPNILDEAPPLSPLTILAAQLTDVMILVLIGAAVISGIIGDLVDTLVIAAIVLLNAVIGF